MPDRRPHPLVPALLALAAAGLPTLAAQSDSPKRHPVTHADVWLMKRLGTPVLSPDGTRAVVSVAEPSYDKDGTVRDLWLVASDGSKPPRRLTSTPGGESSVSFSPSGDRLLFVARRGEDQKSQAYVLDMTAPGEARRVTNHPEGVANPRFSPDGKLLAFESALPAPEKDEVDRDVRVSAYETFPIRYWDRWLNDRQVHLFVQPLTKDAEAQDLLAGTQLVQQEGFSASPSRGQDSLQSCWTPDGNELLFVATTNRHHSAHARVDYHIYRVPVTGGEPTRLTSDQSGSESSPRFAADGKHLFYDRSPRTEFVYNHSHLIARDWAAGSSQRIAPEFDRPLAGFAEHGDELWLIATEHGRRRLFATRIGEKSARLLDTDSRGVLAGITASTSGEVLVARWEDSTHPAEIVRLHPGSGQQKALTAFNRERAAALDRAPFREFWFETPKGRRVHCWLVLPANFDETKKYPLLTWMHGGPHSTCLDADHVRWSPHLAAAPGYVVVMPDYTGSVGYGETFARAIQGDPLQTPGDELLQAAKVAAERFPFVDASRQAALGASYGGHLANWMQAKTKHFKCLVGHAGLVSLEGQWATSDVIHHREMNNGGPPWGGSTIWREQSPSTYAGDFATPMLLTIGESDYRVPLNQTIAAWSYLQRQQVEARLLVFHQANHWIMRGADARYFWREVHAWLARHLQ